MHIALLKILNKNKEELATSLAYGNFSLKGITKITEIVAIEKMNVFKSCSVSEKQEVKQLLHPVF